MLTNGKKKLQAKDKRFAKLYARMLINGNVDWKMLGNIYRPDDMKPIWKAKQTIKRKEIQELTSDEINKLYEDQGITHKAVITEEQRILNSAKESKNLKIQLDVVNNWRDSLDFKPKEHTTITESNYLQLLSKDGDKIAAKQTKELPASKETSENDKE